MSSMTAFKNLPNGEGLDMHSLADVMATLRNRALAAGIDFSFPEWNHCAGIGTANNCTGMFLKELWRFVPAQSRIMRDQLRLRQKRANGSNGTCQTEQPSVSKSESQTAVK